MILATFLSKISYLITRVIIFCLWGSLITSGSLFALWLTAHHSFSLLYPIKEPVTIVLKPKVTLHDFAHQLKAEMVITQPYLMILYVRIFDQFKLVKAGTYEIAPGEALHHLMVKLKNADTKKQEVLRITVIEGFTMKQIANRMMSLKDQFSDKNLTQSSILELMHNQKFIESLGIKAKSLEGYLYPETYVFYDIRPSSTDVIHRMVQHFFRVTTDLRKKLKEQNGSLHQTVIMASLIEKETAILEEKNKISEVIWNRLNRGISLGIDASLSYGIPNYQGDITYAHLRDTSNPYNSRIHKGLPPTPIGSVTLSSLTAVLQPTNFGYLYYVFIPNSGGRHHFSDNLQEHSKFVKKLVRATTRRAN